MATDELSRTFAALADPTRRAILGRLSRGQATVNELAEPFAMTLPAVSRHLQVLERAGLIARGRNAQWRPARLVAEPLAPAADWIDGYRRFWDHSFNALGEHLASLTPPVSSEPLTSSTAKRSTQVKPAEKKGTTHD